MGRDLDFILNAGQRSQLCLYHNAVVMGILHNLLCNFNILGKGLGGSINHNRGKAAVNATLAGFKVRAMVQMQDNRNIRATFHRRFHQLYKIGVIGIGTGAL